MVRLEYRIQNQIYIYILYIEYGKYENALPQQNEMI